MERTFHNLENVRLEAQVWQVHFVSFPNISIDVVFVYGLPALYSQETEAWQKLIRVLTHEIMNSITPVISLSEMLPQQNHAPA